MDEKQASLRRNWKLNKNRWKLKKTSKKKKLEVKKTSWKLIEIKPEIKNQSGNEKDQARKKNHGGKK